MIVLEYKAAALAAAGVSATAANIIESVSSVAARASLLFMVEPLCSINF